MKATHLKRMALCGLALCGVSVARAQEEIHITPPSVGRVEQVAPIGGMAAKSVEPVEVKTNSIVDAVLAKLRAREMTPQAAWASGVLDVDDLLFILSNRIDQWGGFFYEKDDALRRAISQLLAEHGGEKLQDTSKLALPVRLWLADYYGSIGDKRVLELSESIVAELKPGAVGQEDLAFQALEREVWFYGRIGQPLKAAETWERVPQIIERQDWWQADAYWLGSQLWLSLGNEAKATAAFKNLSVEKQPFFYAAAIEDRAFIAYRKSNDAEARRLGAEALSRFGESDHWLKGGFVHQVETMLAMLDSWEKTPIITPNKKWQIAPTPLTAPVASETFAFPLLTRNASPLTFECDAPDVKFQLQALDGAASQDDWFRLQLLRKLQVEASPAFIERGGRAVIKVRSVEHPNFVTELTVFAPKRPLFELSPASAFLGVIEPDGKAEKSVRVEAKTPFRITGVENVGNGEISVDWKKEVSATHALVVRAQGVAAGPVRKGVVRLVTDLPNQEVIELPYTYAVR